MKLDRFFIIFMLMIIVLFSVLVHAEVSGDNVVSTPPEQGLENVEANEKVKVEKLDDEAGHKYTFEDGGSLSVTYTDKIEVTYENLLPVGNDAANLVFGNDGLIKEAKFKTGKEMEVILGNEEIFLPKDSIVIFKNGVAEIEYPAGNQIKSAKPIRGMKARGIKPIEYKFRLSGNNREFDIEGLGKLTSEGIGYQEGKYFLNRVGKSNFRETIIHNDNGQRVYLDNLGKKNTEYVGAYISINENTGTFAAGVNTNTIGPRIEFTSQNKFGLSFEANDHYVLQIYGNAPAGGSHFGMQKRDDQKKFPEVAFENQFAMNQNDGSLAYNSQTEKLYIYPKKNIVDTKDMNIPKGGTSTVHIWGSGFKRKGGELLPVMPGANYFGFSGANEFAAGKNPEYMIVNLPHQFRGGKYKEFKRGFSNQHLYYNIKDEISFERFFNIPLDDYIGYAKNPNNIRMITDVLLQLPGKTRNNLKRLEFYSASGGFVAWAHTSGKIRLSNRGFTPGTFRHELGHLQDYKMGGVDSRLYASVGGHDPPYITGQGRRDYGERISTFVGGVYKSDAFWKDLIQKYPRVKGRIAVLNKMQYITMGETERILGAAGYAADPDSLAKYIREAQK
tara:strand:+ start:3807 stop:5651 length:1845 start_codon:yes stop_codon:yes gene_type:complete